MEMATRVLLVINERLFRESLRAAMTQRLGMEIIGEAADGREALDRARELSPDLVILQPGLRDLNGAETIHRLHLERPGLPVIAVSPYSDYPLVMRVLKAGARAFILTDGGPVHQEIVKLLIDGDADVNLADFDGVTPLQHAQRMGYTIIAQMLIDAGAY